MLVSREFHTSDPTTGILSILCRNWSNFSCTARFFLTTAQWPPHPPLSRREEREVQHCSWILSSRSLSGWSAPPAEASSTTTTIMLSTPPTKWTKSQKRGRTRNNMIALMVGWKVKFEMLKRWTIQPHDSWCSLLVCPIAWSMPFPLQPVKCPLINLKNVNNTQFTAPAIWDQFVS